MARRRTFPAGWIDSRAGERAPLEVSGFRTGNRCNRRLRWEHQSCLGGFRHWLSELAAADLILGAVVLTDAAVLLSALALSCLTQ